MSKFNPVNFLKNLDKNILLMGIAIIAIIIVGVLISTGGNSGQFLDKIKNFGGESKDDLAKKGIDYINNSILSGQKAALVSSSEESGLVKMKISIGGSEFDSYMSKDGKLLFPEAIKLDDGANKTAGSPTEQQPEKTCEDLVKSDKPELGAYIVSQCPFGLQMQRVLADVIKSAPSLAGNIKVRYIGSISDGKVISMHGDKEAQENLKQICIRDEQASKYWDYISCYMKAGDADRCLTSTGIDKNKLSGCTTDSNRGLVYAKEDFDLSSKYEIQGSPTLILDGQKISEFNFGGRTSESIKNLICCGSKTQPSVCSQRLNTASAASSFSETYVRTGGSGNSGNAGVNCAPAQ